jgi:hypothetical protein
VPRGGAQPARPLALHPVDHRVVAGVAAEVDQHLVEHDVVDDDRACGGQPVGEAAGKGATAVDQLADPVAPQLAQRRPDGEAARPAGGLRHEVAQAGRGTALSGEVGGGVGQRPGVHRRVRTDGEAAVVRHVEPLVPVTGPRVSQLDPFDQVGGPGRGGGPEPERPVDVHPRAVASRHLRRLGQRVARAGVDVPSLQAHDRRPGGPPAQDARQVGHVEGAVVVRRHLLDGRGPEAQQPQGPVDGCVALPTGDHPHRGRPAQAIATDVPPHLCQDVLATCGETHGVGSLSAGHEADRCRGRQAEQVLEPATRHAFGGRGGRGQDRVERALVPPGRHEVGGAGGRQRAADHEAEEPGPGRGEEPVGEPADQLPKHHGGRCATGRQVAADPGGDLVDPLGCDDRPFVEGGAVRRSDGRRAPEQFSELVHAADGTRLAGWGPTTLRRAS